MTTPQEKMDYGITRLVSKYPFFAPIGLKLKVNENVDIQTMRTNGVNLEYSPVFIAGLSQKQTMLCILHEWYHILRLHHSRKYDRNHHKWNMACDYEINGDLLKLRGLEKIEGMLHERKFEDLPAEAIYARLPEDDDEEQSQQGMIGEVEQHPDIQEADGQEARQAVEQQVKNDIAAGIQLARMQGKLSADMERILGKLVEPQVDWKSALIDFVQQTSRNDYTFKRPNTRFAHTGFFLPSLYSEQIESLVFACDTSGSIGDDELKEYTADLISAFESVDIQKLYVIWCDSSVKAVQEFEKSDDINLKPKGGGGTDFRPPFRYVDREGIEPAGLIYLTDGYCSDFGSEPDYPVLWCVYGGNDNFTPPYGRVLKVNF